MRFIPWFIIAALFVTILLMIGYYIDISFEKERLETRVMFQGIQIETRDLKLMFQEAMLKECPGASYDMLSYL